MIWFTSDLHFGHANVITYCKRPFQHVHHMNQELLNRWNESIQDDDVVYILGDLSMMKPSSFIPFASGLRGQKILIRGNHDSYSAAQYHEMGFLVFDEAVITLWNRRVRLSHYPHWPRDAEEWDEPNLRFRERRPPRDGKVLLHGHVHQYWKIRKQEDSFEINVGVDVWDFKPVSLKALEKIIMGDSTT